MALTLDESGLFQATEDQRIAVLEQALVASQTTLFKLEERLNGVDRMLDEPGWHQLFQHGRDGGLTLQQCKVIAFQLRELLAANPTVKRGSQIRATYVWGGGVEFSARKADGSATPLTAQTQNRIALPKNKRYVFSANAHEEFERAAYTDGNLFLLGDDQARTFSRVPMSQITADLRNPDNFEEVWMFRREWDRNPDGEAKAPEHQVVWYYTDIFDGPRRRTVQTASGGLEQVDVGKTMLHGAVNQQVGWTYGVADALPIIAWVKLYREFLSNGFVMSRALATLAFKVTSQSANAVNRAAAEIALPGQAGRAMSTGAGNDISAVTTAGKGYDFGSGKPLAASVAAGIEVSVEALLAENTADTLDITAKASATMRRLNWGDYFDRILGYLGNTRTLVCTWQDLPVEQIQRQMQAWALARASGSFGGEVIQRGMAQVLNIADPGPLPDYYADLLTGGDTQGTLGDAGGSGAAGSTDGTGQGQGDGVPTGNSDTRKGVD